MQRHYSRLESVEEKRNLKKAILFVVLTLVVVGFLATFGLPLIAKVSGLLIGKKSSGENVSSLNTPPAPPKFNVISDAVKESPYEVTGHTEIGNTVVISFNSSEEEILPNDSGDFSIKLNLVKGENTFFAYSKNAKGTVSKSTQTYKVIFDNEAPKIEITEPKDESSFYGSKKQNVTIKGTTEVDSTLTVNDRFIGLNDDGSFSYGFSLSEGENVLNFKSVDKAGNETSSTLKLNFSL